MNVRLRRAAFWTLAAMGWGAGCSVIVPGDLPAFQCTAGDPTSCPSGLVCDPGTLVCVGPLATVDADEDVSTGDPDSSTPDAPKTLSTLGGGCIVDGDCATGLLCGTSAILTTAIVPVNSQSICTTPCCTTADCAQGFVCFSGATGGNYCVAADKADRTPPATGGKGGGQTCSTAADCRSGLCGGRCSNAPGTACSTSKDCPSGTCAGPRRCVDTCCGGTECASGSICRILTVLNDSIWACGAPNAGAAKDLNVTCTDTDECKNDNCVGFPDKRCTPPCCKSNDCTALGFTNNVCAYGQTTGNGRLKWCFAPVAGADRPIGAACQSEFDCASHYCDSELRKCLNVCCQDEDCGSGEICRPSPDVPPLLRCVKPAIQGR